jgi:hypothetical protein
LLQVFRVQVKRRKLVPIIKRGLNNTYPLY